MVKATNALWIAIMLKLAVVTLPLAVLAYAGAVAIHALPQPAAPVRISPYQYVERAEGGLHPVHTTTEGFAGP